MKIKAYVEGNFVRHLKYVSVGYCIVNSNRKVTDEFGMSVGYKDYSLYIEKFGASFVGLISLCKLLETMAKSYERFSKCEIEVYSANPFAVYAARILQNKEKSMKLLNEYIFLYPVLYKIKRYMSIFDNITVKHSLSLTNRTTTQNTMSSMKKVLYKVDNL